MVWRNLMLVSKTTSRYNPSPPGEKPAHWVDDAGTSFQNPWKSFRPHTLWHGLAVFKIFPTLFMKDTRPIAQKLTVRRPNWGANPSTSESSTDKIKATWLGHACFLVELPSRARGLKIANLPHDTERGIRILFDPVFNDRCSPSRFLGPKRFTQPPCSIEDIPEIDAVVISHNHYDHLDTHTLQTLLRRSERIPHFFAPLGNEKYFQDLGVPATNTHTMDWRDSKRVEVSFTHDSDSAAQADGSGAAVTKRTIDITCTPCQHFTGRSFSDTFKSLWASWAIEEVITGDLGKSARPPVKVYFAGDTGYRTVLDNEDEDEVPYCPAFEEIGKTLGGFDFAMIPIGAYLPRAFMSRIHCAPQDSVRIFKDIKAKKALGMHWGTWVLTAEDVVDPANHLAEECIKSDIDEDAFNTCDIGETRLF